MRRLFFLIVIGMGGFAVLISLGMWQVQRLEWKQGIIAEINARIAEDPVSLPANPDPEADKYLPVTLTGDFVGDPLFVLTSIADVGPGYRVIQTFRSGETTLLVDRGFVRDGEQSTIGAPINVEITGNLHWPEERHGGTPDPDGSLWFAREVGPMSDALGTAPIMVITRTTTAADPAIRSLPIDTSGIPNDHLNYAITWFLMAAVWAAMTGAFVWQMRGGNTNRQSP